MAVEHLEQGLRGRLAGATDVRVERGGDLLAGLNADGKADHALCRRGDRAGKGGAARSVSVSRCGALIREPQVFRFDRPLSNLHARLRVEMRAGIKALRRRLKTTTIHVTHDQIEAMTMADIVVVMHDGRRRFQMAANGPCLPVLPDSPGEIGQGVVDGLRPEHLAIDPAGDLSLALSPVAPAGRETHVHARLGEQTVRLVSTGRVTAVPGDLVAAGIDPDGVHLFDAATGNRL